MKITCQSCQAKYTIADDKVLGKIVKIRCKKCMETIVVNGSDGSGGYTPEPAGGYDNAGPDDAWTVNVGEGDQRTMTDGEIAAAYQSGTVGDDTYCWRDGMGDWLPLKEIDHLVDVCSATRAAASDPPDAENATRMLNNPLPAGGSPYAGNGTANAFPAAARRAGGRAPGADLFGGAAQAGSEEEVMTSAPSHIPDGRDDAARAPTGARNENSVLFSLSALTSKGQSDRPAPMPGSEQSGLIDIRQLSAQMGQLDQKKRSRVDDIMNLSSGPAFNPALAAPVLTAPALDQYAPAPEAGGAQGGRSRTLIIAAIGGAFIIAAGIGTGVMFVRGKGDAPDPTASASASASAGAPSGTGMAATSPTTTAAATAAVAQAAVTAAATDTAAAPAPAAAAPDVTAAAAATAAAAPTPAATPRPQAAVAAVAAAPAVVKAAAPAPAAAEADAPFNMGEAKSRLAAAAAAVQACKKPDGPAGTGRVVVLFAPSGGAQTATISGAPFEGTPTGACVAARFRGVHVPAFSGSPFSVSKSFTIN